MDTGGHLQVDGLRQRQLVGEERPLGIDDYEVIDQAKLVLRLGDAEIILGCADRLAQVPDLIGEGVQLGQWFWLLLARFLCDLHAQPRFIGLLR
jgi:hypothetical protein